MELVWPVLLGLVPGLPVYYAARSFFLRRKPVVYKTSPSAMTPIIAAYQQRQLEIEGRIAPAAIESPKPVKTSAPKTHSVLVTNHKKWAENKAQIPLVMESIKVLETLAGMSSLNLTTEEQHNLEVLSNQTEELLTNFFNTPESIRLMPAVQQALRDHLTQIEEGVSSVKVKGAEDYVRDLKVSTEFIKTKFNNP